MTLSTPTTRTVHREDRGVGRTKLIRTRICRSKLARVKSAVRLLGLVRTPLSTVYAFTQPHSWHDPPHFWWRKLITVSCWWFGGKSEISKAKGFSAPTACVPKGVYRWLVEWTVRKAPPSLDLVGKQLHAWVWKGCCAWSWAHWLCKEVNTLENYGKAEDTGCISSGHLLPTSWKPVSVLQISMFGVHSNTPVFVSVSK